MIAGNRRQSCCYRHTLLKTASIAAAALAAAATTVTVTALQPHARPPLKPKVTVGSRTSTSLDYVNVAAAPETDVGAQEAQNLAELEKLLSIELSMERPMPVEVGVTMDTTGAATVAPPAVTVKKEKQQKPKKKKRLTLTQKAKRSTTATSTKRRRRKTAPSAIPTATSRLSSAAAQRKRKSQDLESVYWLRREGKKALLTREEEIELTERIRALRAAEQVRDEQLSRSPLTEAQWTKACGLQSTQQLRRLIRQGQEARSQLVQANMGLVTAIASRQHASLKLAMEAGNGVGTILTLQDFLQEGQIGLIKAAERFDKDRGVRFSTYATWWIRQRILRSISDSSRIIRLPAHVHSKLTKIRKARKEMQQEIGRDPSLPELAHYMEMPVDKLQQYTQSSINVVSLENPLRPTGNGKNDIDTRTLGDTIVSDAPTPLEDAQNECLRQDLQQVLLEALTDTERAVIWARYGLEDGNSKTLEETSHDLGISRERVRLVEAKALNKLRSPQKNYRLKTYLGGSNGDSAVAATKRISDIRKANLEAPWMPGNSRTTTADTTNPFASPFDYTSLSQGRSGKTIDFGHDKIAGKTESSDQEEQELEMASSAPAPDRLWFF